MKALKIITVILAIVVISVISFLGVYKFSNNTFKNSVKKYSLGKDLAGIRFLTLEKESKTETVIYDKDGNKITEENKQEGVEYTEENGYTTVEEPITNGTEVDYKNTKKIIEKRLNKLDVSEYTIKQDISTGIITIELAENDNTDYIASILGQAGNFEMIDAETKEVLMDNNDFKEAKVLYNTTEDGTTVYLSMKFNKEGAKKLEEISKTYVQTVVEKTEEENAGNSENVAETEVEEPEDNTETIEKKVTINIDGKEYLTTYFGETLTTGELTISTGTSKDTDTLQEYMLNATGISVFLNNRLPINYELTSSESLTSIIEKEDVKAIVYVGLVIIALIFAYAIIKFKARGIISGILEIGYIAVLLLAIRYTNVTISISGIISIITMSILNYVFVIEVLNNMQENNLTFNKAFTKVLLKLIPLYIISIVLTFAGALEVSSFGMIMFWGFITYAIYNIVFSKLIYGKE